MKVLLAAAGYPPDVRGAPRVRAFVLIRGVYNVMLSKFVTFVAPLGSLMAPCR